MAFFQEIEDGIYSVNTQMNGIFVCTFIIVRKNSAVLIDTGLKKTYNNTVEALKKLGISNDQVKCIVNTHSHHDHIGSNCELKSLYGCPVFSHHSAVPWIENHELQFREFLCRFQNELSPENHLEQFFFENLGRPCKVDQTFENDFEIQSGAGWLKCIHTPGHSSDSISVFDQQTNSIITGDSLMGDGVANTFPQYDNFSEYCHSITDIRKMNVNNIFTAHFNPVSGTKCKNFLDSCEEPVKRMENTIREIIDNEEKVRSRLNIAETLCSRYNKTLNIQTLYTVNAHLSKYNV